MTAAAVVEDPRLQDYAFWQGALQGNPPELVRGVAECGFYRHRTRDGEFIGIAVWRNGEGDLVGRVGAAGRVVEADEEWCERYFAWCAKNPVTEPAYRVWCETGKWPDDVPEVERRSNGEPHIILKETIADMRKEAETWLAGIGGAVTTQEQADKAGNFKDRFAELEKEAVQSHKVAKEPHLKAGREVDAAWKPVAAAGDDAKRWAASLSEAFLKAERARAVQAAAEKAAAGQAVRPEDIKVKAGTRGRGTTLRTYKEVRCTDHAALWAHYRDDERIYKHPDVMRAVMRLAEVEIEAGKEIPGAAIVTEQRAV